MAITNHERVGKALELLRDGLAPFVEREFTSHYGDEALQTAQRFVVSDRLETGRPFAALGCRRPPEVDVGRLERRLPADPRPG